MSSTRIARPLSTEHTTLHKLVASGKIPSCQTRGYLATSLRDSFWATLVSIIKHPLMHKSTTTLQGNTMSTGKASWNGDEGLQELLGLPLPEVLAALETQHPRRRFVQLFYGLGRWPWVLSSHSIPSIDRLDLRHREDQVAEDVSDLQTSYCRDAPPMTAIDDGQ